LDTVETVISSMDEIIVLGKIISPSSSILRNTSDAYNFYGT
jgi:hypothetical protein